MSERQDTPSVALLAPSQAIRAGSQGKNESSEPKGEKKTAPSTETRGDGAKEKVQGGNARKKDNNTKNKNKRRSKNGKKPAASSSNAPAEGSSAKEAASTEAGKPRANNNNNNNKKRRNRNVNKITKASWKKALPEDAVDPVTLDPLVELAYAPFALAIEPPFDPVLEWPVHEHGSSSTAQLRDPQAKAAEHERRVLREQWGHLRTKDDQETEAAVTKPSSSDPFSSKHFHLFDGRALAYWMVSSNQFIDPLNRRDITRDELVNLDQYLLRNNFRDLNVTEAYDVKGVTVSTAGAYGHTAEGRAAILQQEATNLLHALFGNTGVTRRQPSTISTPSNSLASQYAQYEEQRNALAGGRREQQRASAPRQDTQQEENIGIYQEEGLTIIDDDLNPGLRGDAPIFVPQQGSTDGSAALYSASHIASRYNAHQARIRAHEFPSLEETAPRPVSSAETTSSQPTLSKPLPKAATSLNFISKAVKSTDPEEQRRQFEAREAARRKEMMRNLVFGESSGPATLGLSVPRFPVFEATAPTEGQVERNRAFAEALGVQPATMRQQYKNLNSGWKRETKPEHDEFGKELVTTFYPDALILQARERLEVIQKVERKWLKFLEDDRAASTDLNKMDRPTRTFVHEYSDYWNLHTQSYDPEPRRYIHCIKQRETRAPVPLLSKAVREWRGPSVLAATTAASTKPTPVEDPVDATSSEPATERTPLQLQMRTLPIGSRATPSPATFSVAAELERQRKREEEQARIKREKEETKRRALEAAFASDSEEDSDSEWEEQAPQVTSDDESGSDEINE